MLNIERTSLARFSGGNIKKYFSDYQKELDIKLQLFSSLCPSYQSLRRDVSMHQLIAFLFGKISFIVQLLNKHNMNYYVINLKLND